MPRTRNQAARLTIHRRLDCPAFLRASKTGQPKRRIRPNLSGGALNGHF